MVLLCAIGGACIGAIAVAVEVRTAFITVPVWKLDHYTFDYPNVKDGKIHTWQIRDCGDWHGVLK
jgi:hypothetical protein